MSEWLTQAEVAERLGITARQIHNLTKSIDGKPGIPSTVKDGRRAYKWPEASHWYIAYKLEVAKPKGDDAKEDAQTRKLLAEAALKELDLAKQQGQLLDADYVEQQVTGILERLRSRILASRGRYAPQLVGLKTVGEVQIKLEKLTDELLDALAAVGDDPSLDPDVSNDQEAADAGATTSES